MLMRALLTDRTAPTLSRSAAAQDKRKRVSAQARMRHATRVHAVCRPGASKRARGERTLRVARGEDDCAARISHQRLHDTRGAAVRPRHAHRRLHLHHLRRRCAVRQPGWAREHGRALASRAFTSRLWPLVPGRSALTRVIGGGAAGAGGGEAGASAGAAGGAAGSGGGTSSSICVAQASDGAQPRLLWFTLNT